MKKILTIITLITSITVNAQNFVWARSFGSAGTGIFSQSYDAANEIATDPSGNIIVAGYFNGTVDFDPSIFVSSLTSAGNDDVFIAKYNSNGNLQWVKQLGNTNQDNVTDLKCDAAGNIYFTGNFSGTVDFNPSASVLNLTAVGGSDIYAVKYDNNGNLVYAKSMGGTSGEYGWALDIDNTGALYLTGSFNGTADFDPSAATYTLTSNGLQDVFVTKLSNTGSFVWANKMGGPAADYPSDIALNTAQNLLYMVCTFSNTITNGVTTFTSAGKQDVYMQRIPTASGGLNSAKTYGGTDNDYVSDLTLDANDNMYLTGSFAGLGDFDPSPAAANLVVQTTGDNDAYLSKLNSNFVFSWVKQIESTSTDGGNKIKLDSDNNIYWLGYFTGPDTDLDPSLAGTYTVANNGGSNQDAFLIKFDPSANYVWGKNWGNASGVNAPALALDFQNNIFTCGDYFAICDFDPDPVNSYSLTASAYGTDAYMFKLSCTLPSTVTTTSNIVPICIGSNTTKTISISSPIENGVTYSWGFLGSAGVSFSPTTGTTTSVSYTASSSFSIVVTATNACGTTTTMVQSVTLYALPSLTITTDFPSVCVGQPNAFHATGAQTYTWNPGYIINNMPSVNFGSGIFTVTATDANGCVNSKTINYSEYPLPTITSSVSANPICAGGTSTFTAGGANTYTWTGGPTTNTYVVGTQGTYTVTGTDVNGCVNTKTVSLTVNALPNVTAVASSTAICSGNSATLTAGGASTYQWSGGPSTASYVVSTAGIYTVSGTNANGCAKTKTVSLVVNSLPTISATQSPSLVCDGNSASLSGTGASTYTWNPTYINGASAIHLIGEPTFTITGTDINGCVNTSTFATNIAANPTVTISGKNTVCLTNPNTLTANGASTYTWNPGALTGSTVAVTPTTTTTYTVNALNLNGCNGSSIFTLNIVTPQTPDICEVTVDTFSIFNHILWDKTLYNNADSFIVYREVSTNIYKRIGAQPYSALSEFIDTTRSVGPANGDPNITSYRYKLQLRDTCGNYSALSPYHNTIYFITNSTGTYFWNTYNIEFQPSTPVTTFDLVRDDNATGTWTVVGSAAGTANSLNDPNYNLYPNAIYRVLANGFNCTPTAKVAQQIIKSKSNVKNNFNLVPTGIKTNVLGGVSIAPNPATSQLFITFNSSISEVTKISVTDVLGKVVYKTEMQDGNSMIIPVNELSNGVYFVKIEQGKNYTVKKFIKE
ncbi:MAG: T9SS type A sorting domain-containing protein [Bacteroidia bacterium]